MNNLDNQHKQVLQANQRAHRALEQIVLAKTAIDRAIGFVFDGKQIKLESKNVALTWLNGLSEFVEDKIETTDQKLIEIRKLIKEYNNEN